MLVVLPVCEKDEHLALLNLELCLSFKEHPVPYDCLITTDNSFDTSKVEEQARQYFRKVEVYKYDVCPLEDKWPHRQNWAWQKTARWIKQNTSKPWLWWEQDAVPLKAGWIASIDEAHKKGRKLYSGPVVRTNGNPYMAGVAVYPSDVSNRAINAIIVRGKPFDIVGSLLDGVVSRANEISHLIQHEVTLHKQSRHWTPEELKQLLPTAVLYHRCEDQSLQLALLGRKIPKPKKTETARSAFFHSGDYGDLLYSLPILATLGSVDLYVGPHGPETKTRASMSKDHFKGIEPLLKKQPYLNRVKWVESIPSGVVNLNMFRPFWAQVGRQEPIALLQMDHLGYRQPYSIAAMHGGLLKIKAPDWTKSWLEGIKEKRAASIIINRTSRYHNTTFPWGELVNAYGKHMAFVGTQQEHEEFTKEYGFIPYIKTRTLLQLAEVIAGADLFIGNQSSAYAIAEGLKCNTIQETYPKSPDCVFNRTGSHGEIKAHGIVKSGNAVYCFNGNEINTLLDYMQSTTTQPPVDDELTDIPLYNSPEDYVRYSMDHNRLAKYVLPQPSHIHHIGCRTTTPGAVTRYCNPAPATWGDRIIMAYRAEQEPCHQFSQTCISVLDENLEVITDSNRRLYLDTPWGGNIAEDMRPFVWHGRLCAFYTDRNNMWITRFTPDLEVEKCIEIRRPGGGHTDEKNWGPFVHNGQLLAVHWLAPTRILNISVNWRNGEANAAVVHSTIMPEMTGWLKKIHVGTPPIYYGNRLFGFFNAQSTNPLTKRKRYAIGHYSLRAEPPFELQSISTKPLMLPTMIPQDWVAPYDYNCAEAVVFASGSLLKGETVHLFFGWNDGKLCRREYNINSLINEQRTLTT